MKTQTFNDLFGYVCGAGCVLAWPTKSFHSISVDRNKRLTKTNVNAFSSMEKLSHSDIFSIPMNCSPLVLARMMNLNENQLELIFLAHPWNRNHAPPSTTPFKLVSVSARKTIGIMHGCSVTHCLMDDDIKSGHLRNSLIN